MSEKTTLDIFESNILMTLKQISDQKSNEFYNLMMFKEVEYDYVLKKLLFHKDELKQELTLLNSLIDSIVKRKYYS